MSEGWLPGFIERFGVAGVLALTFLETVFPPIPSEVVMPLAGIAGGTAVLGQKLLEAIFGDQAVRSLAAKARGALLERVEELYAVEAGRYHTAIDGVSVARDQGRKLSAAAMGVRAAR